MVILRDKQHIGGQSTGNAVEVPEIASEIGRRYAIVEIVEEDERPMAGYGSTCILLYGVVLVLALVGRCFRVGESGTLKMDGTPHWRCRCVSPSCK